jgi:hypothetical protein
MVFIANQWYDAIKQGRFKIMTGIRQTGEQWEAWIDGKRVYSTWCYTRAYEALHDIGARFGYDHAALVAKVQATREQMQQEVTTRVAVVQDATETAQPVKASKGRCPHYKAIRRAFAIAVELGLDTRGDARRVRSLPTQESAIA